MSWQRVRIVIRTELRQLAQARDFWGPMVILGSLFFIVVPTVLFLTITQIGNVEAVDNVSKAIDVLPAGAQQSIPDVASSGRTSYALAVYLLAPVAIVVPLTISTAVGAASLVGERERGTGEFLAHSPAEAREIYLGKVIASIIPGYLTTFVGFGAYSLIVNLLVGPEVGVWFFPTRQWWVMVLWVLPPFLAIALSVVLRLSARVQSTAAAQQASGLVTLPLIGLAYGQATSSLFGAAGVGWVIGGVAWAIAIASLARGMATIQRSRLLGVVDGI